MPSTSDCEGCCTTCAIDFALNLTRTRELAKFRSVGLPAGSGSLYACLAQAGRHHGCMWSMPEVVKLQHMNTTYLNCVPATSNLLRGASFQCPCMCARVPNVAGTKPIFHCPTHVILLRLSQMLHHISRVHCKLLPMHGVL